MAAESPQYNGFKLDHKKLLDLGEMVVTNEEFCGLVAIRYDRIIGFFIGVVNEYWFTRKKIASDLGLFVDSNRRGGVAAMSLLKAFEKWARSHNVHEISLGITTGVQQDRTEKLYRQLGYDLVGIVCKKKA